MRVCSGLFTLSIVACISPPAFSANETTYNYSYDNQVRGERQVHFLQIEDARKEAFMAAFMVYADRDYRLWRERCEILQIQNPTPIGTESVLRRAMEIEKEQVENRIQFHRTIGSALDAQQHLRLYQSEALHRSVITCHPKQA